MVCAYIYDVLVITKNHSKDHLKALNMDLQRLAETGLKLNAEKSFFGKPEREYIGFWVNNNGVRPL